MIYKIPSKLLRKHKGNLTLPLDVAMSDYPEMIVSLGDSQVLRWLDEFNGITEVDDKIREIKRRIKYEKKRPRSRETKVNMRNLYRSLYELQFKKDYICVVMESDSDYDWCNQGFSVNGIRFRRFLGTNGGIKNSTIVYVNEELYPELKRRLDNGRDMTKALVPAKLEAYQALVCSGSTPLPPPKGFIVVKDCITHFKDNIIFISDENEGEPELSYVDGYDIEHNDSDGYGLMLPSYSRRVNEYLTGDGENTIAGMNTRYAWTKGMVYTFDFVEFAEKVAGTYEITDVWGHKRDVRDAEVILTESMLKLWDSYPSWEAYYENCQKNHYEFSSPKTTPAKLENVRNTNYQFLQSYQLDDDELQQLCQPTIDEIKDVLGMDYRKSIVFLAGFGLNEDNVCSDNFDHCIRALMIDKRMINDPFIRRKIWNMISKRIEAAKRGCIRVNANFAMISGDPYALAQSMFGLEVTGLLKAGEVYHKYWIDKGSDEICCFRAPMTNICNILRMKLNKSAECAHWYQYLTTSLVLNAWDTSCDAMNGCDFDGDTSMCTDNPVLLKRTPKSRPIICAQRKAAKIVPTEADIIAANKLAFNDDIGTITNYVTSMFEVQAGFEPGSPEYEALAYRIMCGQHYQQNTIDRAKGIIAKPMPGYWYNIRDNIVRDGDDTETAKRKQFNRSIAAANKPYFMTFVYPTLRSKNNEYLRNNEYGAVIRFGAKYGIKSIEDLEAYEQKTQQMIDYIDYYHRFFAVGNSPCVVNRICWTFEREFDGYLSRKYAEVDFDYSILKSGVDYSRNDYREIEAQYKLYLKKSEIAQRKVKSERIDDFEFWHERAQLVDGFRKVCEEICSNEKELCDILIDICYGSESSKQFVWDLCGDVILNNLLQNNGGVIRFPKVVEDGGEFTYCGEQFTMCERMVTGDADYFE